jgi:ribosomal protein S12 methylthiotransferase accessory factor
VSERSQEGSGPTVRLAPGVALFATPLGLMVRSRRGWTRVDLHDRAAERDLVSRFGGGTLIPPCHDAATLVLRRAGLLVDAPLGALVAETTGVDGGWVGDVPEHVLFGDLDDAALGARLTARVEAGCVSVVVWSDERGVVVARDDGRARGCPLCVWLLDSALARYLSPTVDIALAPRAYADADRFSGAARALVSEILASSSGGPRPGEVWVVEDPSSPPRRAAVPAHPGCACAVRPASAERMPATYDWSTAAGARHSPVWPVEVARSGRPARVVFRKGRDAWVARPDTLGVALAAGPHAELRALAEAIERFAFLHAPPTVRDTSASALESPALEAGDIRELLFRGDDYAQHGFRFAPYDPDEPQDWCIATSLTSGDHRSVPMSLVGRARRRARALVDATSNGYAAHHDRERAIDSALLELVERDAILLHWYAPTSRPLRLAAPADMQGAQALLVTQDVDLPVVLVLATREDGSLRCGSAAATSLDEALARACAELRVALGGTARATARGSLDDARLRFAPEDHLAALGGAAGHLALDAILATSREATADELRRRWTRGARPRDAILTALTACGLEPFIVDRRLPALFGEGWHVVRALVPGLVELSWGLPYRRLASHRVVGRLAAGGRLSTTPHPIA